MFEITIYPNDLIDLQNGSKLILYDSIAGNAIASIIMEKPAELKVCASKLPTENVDNPVGNCS